MIPLPEWAPNAHPLFVHFPIALLFSAVLFDLIALIAKDRRPLQVTATAVFVLGAVAAILTYLTGDAAADEVTVPLDVQTLLTEHADWALRTVWFYGVYGVVRLVMLRFRGIRMWIRSVVFLVGAAGLILVTETGEHGAEMVFEHGIGVQAVQGEEHEGEDHHHADDEHADEGLSEMHAHPGGYSSSEDGSWYWTVRDDAVDVLGEKARFVQGSAGSLNATTSDSVLSLQLSGEPVLFLMGGALENIQVSAYLNLDEFDGTVELVHHVQGEDTYDFLAVEDGTIKAGRLSDGDVALFDSDSFAAKGWLRLAEVVDGRHSRGYVGDELRVHGHDDAPDPGPAGLRLEGTGVVRVRELGAKVLKE